MLETREVINVVFYILFAWYCILNVLNNLLTVAGEIVQSVLTSSESIAALKKLPEGMMDRYDKAGKPPPSLIYTDRDCCSSQGGSKLKELFSEWYTLSVRLDFWHYMRRLTLAVSSESHPLYATFMSRLSSSIFEWDMEDYNLLCRAKKGQLQQAGVKDPSDSAIR
jgi:hypothetical protein